MKTITELISWFQLEYPKLVHRMKDASHHLTVYDKIWHFYGDENSSIELNPYHLESDVFTHTMMVCKQAENAPYEVRIAALLHDIGKPSTRAVNPKNGRVSFYNHDAVSAFMALEILKREELGLSKEQQVLIFNMIALHTQIYKLSPEKLYDIGDLNLITNLIELGKADHAGRFHTKGDAVIPSIDDIRPISGVSSTRRGYPEKEVVILCGLPGAGKSYYVDKNCKDHFRVSRDESLMNLAIDSFGFGVSYEDAWKKVNQKKVDKELQSMFNRSKEADEDEWSKIVVDMTHMSKKSRRKSLSHFGSEYKKKCVVFLPDLPTLYKQNENREGKVIDKSVIERMMRSFYPPTREEFDEIEYIL